MNLLCLARYKSLPYEQGRLPFARTDIKLIKKNQIKLKMKTSMLFWKKSKVKDPAASAYVSGQYATVLREQSTKPK